MENTSKINMSAEVIQFLHMMSMEYPNDGELGKNIRSLVSGFNFNGKYPLLNK